MAATGVAGKMRSSRGITRNMNIIHLVVVTARGRKCSTTINSTHGFRGIVNVTTGSNPLTLQSTAPQMSYLSSNTRGTCIYNCFLCYSFSSIMEAPSSLGKNINNTNNFSPNRRNRSKSCHMPGNCTLYHFKRNRNYFL